MISRILSAVASANIKGHFGQWAEDALVRKLFPKSKSRGRYLDIGAYHPYKYSNTACLWMKGWCGVNIDPNKNTVDLFRKKEVEISIYGLRLSQIVSLRQVLSKWS